MITTQYQSDCFNILEMMHESWNSPTLNDLHPDTLPKIGFIASNGSVHIAAGFLRMVEGGYAQIDTLVSNSILPGHMRDEGIQLVVDALINTAKSLKLKGIISFTLDKSVICRAVDTGFHVNQHVMLVLPLGVS